MKSIILKGLLLSFVITIAPQTKAAELSSWFTWKTAAAVFAIAATAVAGYFWWKRSATVKPYEQEKTQPKGDNTAPLPESSGQKAQQQSQPDATVVASTASETAASLIVATSLNIQNAQQGNSVSILTAQTAMQPVDKGGKSAADIISKAKRALKSKNRRRISKFDLVQRHNKAFKAVEQTVVSPVASSANSSSSSSAPAIVGSVVPDASIAAPPDNVAATVQIPVPSPTPPVAISAPAALTVQQSEVAGALAIPADGLLKISVVARASENGETLRKEIVIAADSTFKKVRKSIADMEFINKWVGERFYISSKDNSSDLTGRINSMYELKKHKTIYIVKWPEENVQSNTQSKNKDSKASSSNSSSAAAINSSKKAMNKIAPKELEIDLYQMVGDDLILHKFNVSDTFPFDQVKANIQNKLGIHVSIKLHQFVQTVDNAGKFGVKMLKEICSTRALSGGKILIVTDAQEREIRAQKINANSVRARLTEKLLRSAKKKK